MPAPTDQERQKLVDWVKALRTEESQKHAGDPGPVLARRLSNSEYNYTIRDHHRRRYPADKAVPRGPGEIKAGFDNSGPNPDHGRPRC